MCSSATITNLTLFLQKDYYSLQSFLSSVWWPEEQNIGQPDQLLKLQKWEAETVEVREKLLELKKDIFKGEEKNVVKKFPADIQEMYYKNLRNGRPMSNNSWKW